MRACWALTSPRRRCRSVSGGGLTVTLGAQLFSHRRNPISWVLENSNSLRNNRISNRWNLSFSRQRRQLLLGQCRIQCPQRCRRPTHPGRQDLHCARVRNTETPHFVDDLVEGQPHLIVELFGEERVSTPGPLSTLKIRTHTDGTVSGLAAQLPVLPHPVDHRVGFGSPVRCGHVDRVRSHRFLALMQVLRLRRRGSASLGLAIMQPRLTGGVNRGIPSRVAPGHCLRRYAWFSRGRNRYTTVTLSPVVCVCVFNIVVWNNIWTEPARKTAVLLPRSRLVLGSNRRSPIPVERSARARSEVTAPRETPTWAQWTSV